MYSVAVLLKISLFLSQLLAHRSTMAEVQSTTASTFIEQSLPPANSTSVLQPARVSIVSGRLRTWSHFDRLDRIGEIEDLSDWLDRIDDIAPLPYSSANLRAFQQTILAKDTKFIECLSACLSRSTKKTGHGARLFCRFHDNSHASAFVATLETEALNRLRDADGRQVFNARHFHLEDLVESKKIEILSDAMAWAKDFDGRVHVISEGIAKVEDRHGYAATRKDDAMESDDETNIDALKAKLTWLQWHKFENRLVVRNVSTRTYYIDNSEVVVIDDLQVVDPSDDPREELPAASIDSRQIGDEHFQAPRTSMGNSETGFRSKGGCKGETGWDSKGGKGVTGKGDDRQIHVASGLQNCQGTTQTVTTWTSTQPWPDHSDSWWGSSWGHGYGSSWWQEHRPGHREPWETAYQYEQESYAATRRSMIEKWRDTFCGDFDIDDPAWRALISLAQRCAAGYRKANGIIYKMYEREQKWLYTANPSAYVLSCVQHANKDIDARPHWDKRF